MRKLREVLRTIAGIILLVLTVASVCGVVLVGFMGLGAYPGSCVMRHHPGLGLLLVIVGLFASMPIAMLVPVYLSHLARKCIGV